MNQTLKKAALTLFISVIMFSFIQIGRSADNLVLTLTANERYNPGETMTINGSLTLNGSPVPDGLVSIQINHPKGETPDKKLFIMRTLTTGSTPSGPWPVEILEVLPCDIDGDPQSSFLVGGAAGFQVTVQNNGASPQHVLVVLTFVYSNKMPFKTLVMFNATIDGGLPPLSKRRWIEDFIPGDAPLGTAYVYASTLDNWTQYGGIAWCPEKSASFNIVSGGGGSSAFADAYPTTSLLDSTPGTFNITFKTSDHGGILGNYTIYANSWYDNIYAQEIKKFEAILLSDVNRDGTVDMVDISIMIDKFMATPSDPRWDPLCDLINDSVIDMADISIVIDDFLKWGRY